MFWKVGVSAFVAGFLTLGGVWAHAGTRLASPSRPVAADSAEEGSTESALENEEGPDFLFGAPRGSFRVRGGWNFARADSDIFDFVSEQLTIERTDFSSPLLALDLAYRLNERLAVVFGFEYSRAQIQSEFRDYVDMEDLPITQVTRLYQVPLTGSLKFYLIPQGQQVSRYAWVPNSVSPYVGGGGGLLWYRFQQEGDFVDFTDLSIFTDRFESDGWSATVHVLGGVDFKIMPRLFLTVETRYAWSDSELGDSFVGFDPIDLTGLRTSVGIDVLF